MEEFYRKLKYVEKRYLGFGVVMATVFVEIRFLKDVPTIVGADMKTYGPFKEEDVASLPAENAEVLIKRGVVVEVEAQ